MLGIAVTEDNDKVGQKVGLSRLGSINLAENVGATLLIGSLILLILIFVIYCTYRLSKKFCDASKNRERIEKLKNKIFFNPMIRYTLLNCLKFNIVAMTAIRRSQGAAGAIFTAIVIELLFLLIPILYAYILKKKIDMLEEEQNKVTYGTLYKGLCTDAGCRNKSLTWLHPIVFMLRRTAFAIITVFLFDYPLVQLFANQLLCLAYIFWLTQNNLFDDRM